VARVHLLCAGKSAMIVASEEREKNVRINAGSDHVSVMMMMMGAIDARRRAIYSASRPPSMAAAHLFSELSLRVPIETT